ncbi:hypothetical protein O3Q51_01190 [Cryomorphaceae bacterium 1068]|nr:hypothetical protein [Cryomorphaceae bacterium 1068]
MTDETIDQYETNVEARPTFLTVLCVLTWIVSGYTVLTVPFNYFFSSDVTASTLQTTINDAMSQMAEDTPEAAEMMQGFMMAASDTISSAIDNAGLIATTDLLVAILSAFGAFLMFKLRKSGFWIYVLAKVLGLASILVLLGVNILTMGVVSIAGFVGLIMVILYGINRKHMS